ncbi:MAG: hypothetical protein EXQ79_00260 [Acidimicrobiia bacterium]|nr:hypothetical protein [Acidimicrobiia bacterium]
MTGMAVVRRGRGTVAFVAMVVAAIAIATVALSFGAPTATAGPVRDADPGAAAQIAQQIVVADAAIRINTYVLPDAEAKVVATFTAATAAAAEEERTHAEGASAPSVGTGDVLSAATSALLKDLAPEQASATRSAAKAAATAAVQHRDEVKFNLDAAAAKKAELVAALAQGGHRRTLWCVLLLDRLGAPVTSENLLGLVAWIEAESNVASARNPLATTQGAPGAHNVNSVGVKGYPTDEVGLDATVITLHNGHYPAILDALARGDSALRLVQAVAASPWGTGQNAVIRLHQLGG